MFQNLNTNALDLINKRIKSTILSDKKWLIFREVRHFKNTVIIAFIITIIAAAMEGLSVGLIAAFLQSLTNPQAPPLETNIAWIDLQILGVKATPNERILRVSLLLLIMVWFRSALSFWGICSFRTVELKLLTQIRKNLFEQFQRLSLSYYAGIKSGDLIDSLSNQLNQLKLALLDFSNFVTRLSLLIAYIITMFAISWQLSTVSLLLYTFLSLFIRNIVRRVREVSFLVPKADSELSSITIELIQGIRTTKASNAQSFERVRFYAATKKVHKAWENLYKYREFVKPFSEGFATTILLLIITSSYFVLISSNQIGASSLLTFMFVLFRMMPLVSQVNSLHSRLGSYRGAIHNVADLLTTENKPYLQDGTKSLTKLNNCIQFNKVYFSYGKNKPVLQNISIQINKGETTAFVGASGAGKTTLADLIPRFYDVTQGEILIDGRNIKEFTLHSLRNKISIVSQETFIFNTSVAANIAYGLTDLNMEKISKAAALANASDFIEQLPEGYNTILGERGSRLSGGQRQRIAIARALLQDPEILILDEATSSLDSVTEKLIQESLEKLSKGRTVIAIAHRLSTIMNADKIVVLEKGKVVEQGNYKELLDQHGALWNYHKAQFIPKAI